MLPAIVPGHSASSPPFPRKLFSCVTLLPAAYFVSERRSELAPRLLDASSILLLSPADAAALFPDVHALEGDPHLWTEKIDFVRTMYDYYGKCTSSAIQSSCLVFTQATK